MIFFPFWFSTPMESTGAFAKRDTEMVSKGAIINTIFKIAGYTYGPILGLYLTGLFTTIKFKEKWVPFACVSAALITWLLNGYFIRAFNFDFGFMNIFVNALLTILFLFIIRKNETELSSSSPAGEGRHGV